MTFNLLTDLYTENGHKPNFTIITPGPCNAKCDFCFWNAKDGKIKPPTNYLESLSNTITSVPYSLCLALSISGGEPTLSPHFENILNVIDLTPRQWDRVVLTTNGTRLGKWLESPIMQRVVKNINISRHHYEDQANREIFKSNVIPSTDQLKKMISVYGSKFDFNINCIINDDTTQDFIYRMIMYAQFELGIGSISFRKEAGTVDPTAVEKEFVKKFGVESTNGCPVCRTTTQRNRGFRIMWKGSHPQPSQHLNKLYELVFHPNGKVYADWDRKIDVNLNMVPQTDEGKFWFNKWANLVKEFEGFKASKTKSVKKEIVESDVDYDDADKSSCSSGCGSGGCGARSTPSRTSCGGGCGSGGHCSDNRSYGDCSGGSSCGGGGCGG